MMTDSSKKKKGFRTLEEIEACDKNFLVPEDIEPFLGCDRYSINLQAREDPSALQFPICRMGTRVKIPRIGFINWYKYAMAVDDP